MGLSQKTVSFICMKNIDKEKVILILIPIILFILLFVFMFFTLNQKKPPQNREKINIKIEIV